MTEDPKELVAREVLTRLALESGEWGSISFTAGGWNPWPIAVAAMLEYARLTADRERSVGEDVVERVAMAIADAQYHARLDVIAASQNTNRPISCPGPFDGMDYLLSYEKWAMKGAEFIRERYRADARAVIAATRSQVPDGFVLVPKVPTEAMLQAAAETPGIKAASQGMEMHQVRGYDFAPGSFDAGSPLEQAWSAMIATAAPAPALPETGVGK